MDSRTRGDSALVTSPTQPPAFEPIAYCADCGRPLYRQCALCGESELGHDGSACADPEWCRRVPVLCGRCLEVAEREWK